METEDLPARERSGQKHASVGVPLADQGLRKPQQIRLQDRAGQLPLLQGVSHQVVLLHLRYWGVLGVQPVYRHPGPQERLPGSRGLAQLFCQPQEPFLPRFGQGPAEVH